MFERALSQLRSIAKTSAPDGRGRSRAAPAAWRRPRILHRWLGDGRGAVAVEFGLIALPFFLLLSAVIEIGFSAYMSSSLDYATQMSGRAVMTGSVSTAGMSAATFKTNVVCPLLPHTFNCNNVFVNMTIVPQGTSPTGYYNYINATSSGLKQPALNSTMTFCPGSSQQYVVLQILYPASFFTAFFAAGATTNFNGQWVHVLMSAATFRSEPYAGAASYAGC